MQLLKNQIIPYLILQTVCYALNLGTKVIGLLSWTYSHLYLKTVLADIVNRKKHQHKIFMFSFSSMFEMSIFYTVASNDCNLDLIGDLVFLLKLYMFQIAPAFN